MKDLGITKQRVKVKHSESKDAFNVVGTSLGGKYKIARFPYTQISENSEYNKRQKEEAEKDANLYADAHNTATISGKLPSELLSERNELLEMTKRLYEYYEELAMKVTSDDFDEKFRDKWNCIMSNTEQLIRKLSDNETP